MKKTFVIILTVLFLVGIAGLNAEGLDEGEKRLCHVYGNVSWGGGVMNPPGHNGIEGAHVILRFYYNGSEGNTFNDEYTDGNGDYDYGNLNLSAAYTSATITVIVDEGTGHEQSQMVEYILPEDPGIPFIAYDEFVFYPVPDRR